MGPIDLAFSDETTYLLEPGQINGDKAVKSEGCNEGEQEYSTVAKGIFQTPQPNAALCTKKQCVASM